MTINYQQLVKRIMEIGQGSRKRQEDLYEKRQTVMHLLAEWGNRPAELLQRLDHARQADPTLRCALPHAQSLDASFSEPAGDNVATLLAADGSQILPNRHASLFFSLVNIGAIVLAPGSGKTPEIHIESNLIFHDELYDDHGALSGQVIEQRRDIAERRILLELARNMPGRLVALTDGPLELWGAKGGDTNAYHRNLELHKSILSQLQAENVVTVGYVDKPGADLVVRTLEIASLTVEELKDLRIHHPLRHVSDRWFFGENGILKAGQRSAVFGLQSGSRAHYTGDLSLHFFYLNVGTANHPAIARVEIPQWVADDHHSVDILHASLLQQCRVMGARPYPYILHRAHEAAVVKLDERMQVEQMLALELQMSGEFLEPESNKSFTHSLPSISR